MERSPLAVTQLINHNQAIGISRNCTSETGVKFVEVIQSKCDGSRRARSTSAEGVSFWQGLRIYPNTPLSHKDARADPG